MMTLAQIIRELKTRNLNEVARATKQPYFRLYRLASGATKDPGHNLVVALSNYLKAQDDIL